MNQRGRTIAAGPPLEDLRLRRQELGGKRARCLLAPRVRVSGCTKDQETNGPSVPPVLTRGPTAIGILKIGSLLFARCKRPIVAGPQRGFAEEACLEETVAVGNRPNPVQGQPRLPSARSCGLLNAWLQARPINCSISARGGSWSNSARCGWIAPAPGRRACPERIRTFGHRPMPVLSAPARTPADGNRRRR